LALRQTEGLIGSVIAIFGFDLAVPDHTTLSWRAESLAVARPRPGSGPVHLLVDSIGQKLCGFGEWLLENMARRHGSRGASCTSAWTPTPCRSRGQHLQSIADRGHLARQNASGDNWRAMVEATLAASNASFAKVCDPAPIGVERPRSRLP